MGFVSELGRGLWKGLGDLQLSLLKLALIKDRRALPVFVLQSELEMHFSLLKGEWSSNHSQWESLDYSVSLSVGLTTFTFSAISMSVSWPTNSQVVTHSLGKSIAVPLPVALVPMGKIFLINTFLIYSTCRFLGTQSSYKSRAACIYNLAYCMFSIDGD